MQEKMQEKSQREILRQGFWEFRPIWKLFGKVKILDLRFYCCLWTSPMSCLLCDMRDFLTIAVSGDILKNMAKLDSWAIFAIIFLSLLES